MKEDIIKICSDIKANNHCNTCGGNYDNHTCRYCGNNNDILENLINKLKDILSNLTNIDEDILNSLFSIKDLEISGVNDILIRYNHKEKLENKYYDIHNKITNDNLSNEDYQYIIYFLDNNLYLGKNTNYYINHMMKKLLTDNLNVKIEDKMILIKHFTEMFMRGKVRNPKCTFDSLKGNTIGESIYDRILLDKDEIIIFLEKKDYVKMLELIFHECTHTYQTYIRSVDKEISYMILKETKETLIKQKNPEYYNENYIKYSDEVEARYCGANFTLQYLNALGLKVSNNDYFIKVMEREQKLFYDDERTINGEITTVDEAFSRYVHDTSLLSHYPVLKIEYKNNNGLLTKKTEKEILEDYNNYKNGTLIIEGNPTAIEGLYTSLLGDEKGKVK